MAKTDFDKFIAERIKENQGVLVPVKASLFELMFVKKQIPKSSIPIRGTNSATLRSAQIIRSFQNTWRKSRAAVLRTRNPGRNR